MFSRTLFLLTSALLLCARATGGELELREDAAAHTLTVVRPGGGTTLVTLRARPDARPSVHPAAAPDGRGRLTGPEGVFWAFPSLNGRDYVKNSDGSHWRRVSSGILLARGEEGNLAARELHADIQFRVTVDQATDSLQHTPPGHRAEPAL